MKPICLTAHCKRSKRFAPYIRPSVKWRDAAHATPAHHVFRRRNRLTISAAIQITKKTAYLDDDPTP